MILPTFTLSSMGNGNKLDSDVTSAYPILISVDVSLTKKSSLKEGLNSSAIP